MPLLATDVFTPNDYPKHTYIERGGDKLESRLADALRTPKAVVSISGPSKSGKTALVERVVGRENLISVSGAEIKTGEELWDRVLDWMGAPSGTATQTLESSQDQLGGKVSGGVEIPLIAKGGGESSYQHSSGKTTGSTETNSRKGLAQVAKDIAGSDFTLLIDDYHYMDREVQADAAKQIKTAAERGIRICVASVPHRADDVVRSNPELRGRTTNLDTKFWTPEELSQIALVGFSKLNGSISADAARRFAREACGSPQLMQAICLQVCYKINLREASSAPISIEVDDPLFSTVMEITSLQTDYSSLIAQMHQGPKIRGVERKEFELIDGSVGDVYRCVLLAVAQDPPTMDLPYPVLMKRVEAVSKNASPVGSSVKEACKQIANFARGMYPTQRIVEFDDEAGADTLSIVDPYWLFYLRSSTKLASLAKQR